MLNAKQKDFIVATWRAVGQMDPDTGLIPMQFDLPGGGVLRLLVPAEGADTWVCALIYQGVAYDRTKVQRAMSSGSPSVDGSTMPGQEVRPAATSSQAD